jgi:hypothetical protein
VFVLAVPVTNKLVLGSDDPICTVPPPDVPFDSEPISTWPVSPMASVAPVLTLNAGANDDALLMALLIVKVAPVWTPNE